MSKPDIKNIHIEDNARDGKYILVLERYYQQRVEFIIDLTRSDDTMMPDGIDFALRSDFFRFSILDIKTLTDVIETMKERIIAYIMHREKLKAEVSDDTERELFKQDIPT